MHFGTFPVLTGTPDELRRLTAGTGVTIEDMSPGDTLTIPTTGEMAGQGSEAAWPAMPVLQSK